MFDTFGSAWRSTGLGSASPAPAALALIGAMGTVLLGAVGLAQTLTVVRRAPARRVRRVPARTRHVIGLRGPALAAGLAYGINPVARNAIAQGRLGPLVLFALLPFLLLRIVRLGARDDTRRGRVLRLAVLAALLGAWYPVGLGLFVLAAAALGVAIPIARSARMALRAFGIAVVAALGGVVLLLPWPLAYAHTGVDKAALGFAFRPDLDLSQILRFDTGPAAAGWAMWGLVVAAAVPLFVATGDRLAWTARGWVLALVGWAVGVGPGPVLPRHLGARARSRAHPRRARARAVRRDRGVGVRRRHPHVPVRVAPTGRDHRGRGRHPAPRAGVHRRRRSTAAGTRRRSDWTSTLAFTQALTAKGEFRMLWVGDPSVLPLDPVVLRDGTGYTLTRNGPGDVTEQWRAPEHDADHVVDRAVGLADRRAHQPSRSDAGADGRALRRGAEHAGERRRGERRRCRVVVRAAMAQQLDLGAAAVDRRHRALREPRVRRRSAASVHRSASRSTRARPNRAALGADLADATPLTSAPAPAGTVFWGEAYDSEWKASRRRHRVAARARPSAGPTATARTDAASVSITYDAQWQRWAMLGGALVLWLLVVWRWRRTRVRRDPASARGRRLVSVVNAPSATTR